ncbi:hypothetical protein NLX62_05215, partial [Mycobacteriaceae bacterium Msp059]|nr:hypothetical protein [Mycobacteriaceae bacterium Msp059]
MPDSDTAALTRIVANTRRMGPELRRQWVRRVLACSDLTATQKNVLVALETYADWDDGTNAHPGETNLSEHCDIGTRAVRAALARGRELRLIERTAAENPRAGLAAVYRLVFDEPETGATEPESDPTTGPASPVNNSTTGTASPVNNSTTGSATSPSPAQPCLPPSQSPNSFGLRNSGTSPAPVEMTQNPPAPSRYCELHPQGTQGGCWGCKRAGAAFRAWQAEQAVIDVAIADAALPTPESR